MQWKNNLLYDLRETYAEELSAYYEAGESKQLLNLLIQHFFGISQINLALDRAYRLTESEMLQLHFAIKELKRYRPIQYILGKTQFLDLQIKVDKTVLIPRPETEELVQLIIRQETQAGLKVLDIGTGSGCIAIALAKHLKLAKVSALDISTEALSLAASNAALNNQVISFFNIDILHACDWEALGNFDILVSNPPYVRESEKEKMQANVLEYEPHQALFVPDTNALLFYEHILEFSRKHLKVGGRIYFEINESQGASMLELLAHSGFTKYQLHKDIHNKGRFVRASR